MSPLTVERVLVRRDRLVLLVRVEGGAAVHLSPNQANYLRAARPTLTRHACLNAQGLPFNAILETTSLPHVLEHLIVDFQGALSQDAGNRSATGRPLTFVGTTEWLDEGAGLARIEVNLTDDLVALEALKRARALLDEGMVQEP